MNWQTLALLASLSAVVPAKAQVGNFPPGAFNSIAAVSGLPGPPVLSYVAAQTSTNGGANPQPFPAYTLPASGGPYWIGFIAVDNNSASVSSVSLTPTNGTASCTIDSQAIGTLSVAVGHCTTSAANPGSTTASVTYSATTFAAATLAMWSSPLSGFASAAPVGANSTASAAVASISTSSSATSAGFCLHGSNVNSVLTAPAASTAASTFTYTQRTLFSGGAETFYFGDAPAASTTTQTAAVTWSGTGFTTGTIGIATGCWR